VQSTVAAVLPQLSVATLHVGVNEVCKSPLHDDAGAVHVVCVDVGVPQAVPEAHVGVNLVRISGRPVGPPPVHVVVPSGQDETLEVLPQTPAPVQLGVKVVKEPALQVEACVGHTVSAGVPGLAQPFPAVLQAAVNVRRVGTVAPGAQIGAPAVHAVVADVTPQPPGSAQLGVRVVT
jgi:hypothetical protein